MKLIVGTLIALGMAQGVAAKPTDTTLCAVVHDPRAFDGKIVRFRAGVLTDWTHATVLVHTGCKHGIELSSTERLTREQSDAFDSAVGNPMTGGYDRTAMATFIGKFSWKPTEQGGNFQNAFQFDAYAVQTIKVYPRRSPRP